MTTLNHENLHTRHVHPTTQRQAGWLLAGCAIGMAVLMAMHPTFRSHELDGIAQEAAEGMWRNRVVHGLLVLLGVVSLAGWSVALEVLGRGGLLVRIVMCLLIASTACACGAGLINGFVVPAIAEKYAGLPQEALAPLGTLLQLCLRGNRVLAQADVLGASLSSIALGLLLAWGQARRLWLGGFAIMIGVAFPTLLLAGRLPMNVHGFGAFVLAHSVWMTCVGVALIHGTLVRHRQT